MAISTIDGVESIRILRAGGNLKISGSDRPAIEIDSGVAPRVTTNAGVAEVTLRDNAVITVPAGVTVEVEDLAGNLDLSDLATPFHRHSRARQSARTPHRRDLDARYRQRQRLDQGSRRG